MALPSRSVGTSASAARFPTGRRIQPYNGAVVLSERPFLFIAAVLLGAGIAFVFTAFPVILDTIVNRPRHRSAGPSDAARRIHGDLHVVDLHADTLLWNRDLLKRSSRGSVDLPRLTEGRVAVQVFSAVTRFPAGPAVERSGRGPDLIRLLVMAERWPPRTWGSPLGRALYQARRLQDASDRSDGRLVVLRSALDVERLLTRRKSGSTVVGGILALEGIYPLEGRFGNIGRLHEAGFRLMGLTHFSDTEAAGSAHGTGHGGLTPFGRELIRGMEARGIVLDLAHVSPRAFDEALEVATKPAVVSHSGVQGTCPGPRNLSDEQLRRVADNGGVVGIAYFEWTVCGRQPDDVARAVRHAVDVAGIDHVALGSDWDGAVRTALDAAGVPILIDALVRAGFTDEEIRKIASDNALRVLRASLI